MHHGYTRITHCNWPRLLESQARANSTFWRKVSSSAFQPYMQNHLCTVRNPGDSLTQSLYYFIPPLPWPSFRQRHNHLINFRCTIVLYSYSSLEPILLLVKFLKSFSHLASDFFKLYSTVDVPTQLVAPFAKAVGDSRHQAHSRRFKSPHTGRNLYQYAVTQLSYLIMRDNHSTSNFWGCLALPVLFSKSLCNTPILLTRFAFEA